LNEALSMESLRRLLDASPMSRAQWLAVGCAFALAAIDGFDVLTLSMIAPALRQAWHLDFAALGLLLSSGNVGVAIGLFVLAPVADFRGRREVLLACMTITSLGMFFSALAQGLGQLIAFRILVGMGIGGCTAVAGALVSEVTNFRWRSFSFGLLAVGLPVGGTLGGFFAAYLLAHSTWRNVFLSGSVGTLILIPLFVTWVPEPLDVLALHRGKDRMARINRLLKRFGHPAIDDLSLDGEKKGRSYGVVFARHQIPTTAWATAAVVFQVLAIGFTTSWLPQLITYAGFPASTASLGVALMSLAGIAGAVLFGALATPKNVKVIAATAAFGFGLSIIGFGLAPAIKVALLVGASFCGFFLYVQLAAFQSLVAGSFRGPGRATGIGFVLGMGRICGIVAPTLAGVMLYHGASRATVSEYFSVCAFIASGVILLRPKSRAAVAEADSRALS
jgi:MFS transporter, AAHS family, 4-hydroxybenzoate transporter